MSKQSVKRKLEQLETKTRTSKKKFKAVFRECGGPYKVGDGVELNEEEFKKWKETLGPEIELWVIEIVENKPPVKR